MNTRVSNVRRSAAALLAIFSLASGAVFADTGEPIRILKGFSAGGGKDRSVTHSGQLDVGK